MGTETRDASHRSADQWEGVRAPYGLTSPVARRPENAGAETLKSISRKRHLMRETMVALKDQAFSPDRVKRLQRRWRIGQVADMVGRTPQAIRDKQREGKLRRPDSPRDYTLEDINEIRRVFGTLPWRAPEEEPVVLAFQTFKGGAGKSTLAVHFAQYMAIKGYRVLFVDCDPQGSASTLFGAHPALSPDQLLGSINDELDYSLEEYLSNLFDDFSKCVRSTYFTGVDIVPAGLTLNNADYYLAAEVSSNPELINRLQSGIHQVWHDYDCVVLDPPPALGLLSLSVMNAANGLVIPLKPTVIDFASTWQFLEMSYDNISALNARGLPPYYHFNVFVVNNLNDAKSAHVEITQGMRQMFSEEDMISAMMRDSAEIDNAAKEMQSVYDLNEAMTTRDVHSRCLRYLDRLNSEIEVRVRRTWPSHTEALRKAARI